MTDEPKPEITSAGGGFHVPEAIVPPEPTETDEEIEEQEQ